MNTPRFKLSTRFSLIAALAAGAVAGLLGGCDASLPAQSGRSGASLASRGMPANLRDPRTRGPAFAETNGGQFAVDMFLQVNWPALPGYRGRQDVSARIGKPTPTVWETFKNSSEIYRPRGAVPPTWETVAELPAGVIPPTPAQLAQWFGPADSAWLHFLAENRMIDGQQVVDARTNILRYDVRCNEDHFNYVVKNRYPLFNLEGQRQALADPNFTFSFPSNAVEVKAAWRVLGTNDDASRYWTAYGAFYNQSNQLTYARIGLTAFHVISRVLPDWVWLTYEQADIGTNTYQYFLQEKGAAVGPNPTVNPQAAAYNQQLRQITVGTKWQNYRIVGWQTAMTAGGQPTLLANMNIETYFPRTSSCMSCHDMANIGPAAMPRLNLWNTAGGDIVGRVGTINFPAIAKQLAPQYTFKQMDYVWSLQQAQSTNAPQK